MSAETTDIAPFDTVGIVVNDNDTDFYDSYVGLIPASLRIFM